MCRVVNYINITYDISILLKLDLSFYASSKKKKKRYFLKLLLVKHGFGSSDVSGCISLNCSLKVTRGVQKRIQRGLEHASMERPA